MILGTILRLEARTCVRFGIGTQRIGSSAARTQRTWSPPTAVRFSTRTLLQPLSKRPSIPPLRSLRLARSTTSAPPPPPRRPEPILEPYDDLPPSPGTSRLRLLLTPTLFTLLVLSGSYYYTTQHTYLAPRPSERIFPGLTVAEATVYSLIAANAAVFLLWKVPHPANWRLLNKYFVNSASAPTALSMLGSTFSHQSFLHLAINCFALAGFGVDVCEQVGRGNFLALYASAGVLSSWCSLGWSVLGKRFVTHALGASGAILGLVGAFINFHPKYVSPRLTLSSLQMLTFPALLALKSL